MTRHGVETSSPRQPSLLILSGHTLSHEGHAYPLQNISYFGPGTRPQTPLPWPAVIGAFISSLLFEMADHSTIATLFILSAIAMAVYNFVKRKQHGMVMEMNSGRVVFFSTTDKKGVKQVTSLISEILSKIDLGYPPTSIAISETNVLIHEGASIAGNINTGIVHGNMIHEEQEK